MDIKFFLLVPNLRIPKYNVMYSENGNDLKLAEAWLREQAQAQGWAKAQKLQVRKPRNNRYLFTYVTS